jgi:hypothetical protein
MTEEEIVDDINTRAQLQGWPMGDEIDKFLRSEETAGMMASIFRDIGISPPPHNINTGKVLSRLVLTSLAELRKRDGSLAAVRSGEDITGEVDKRDVTSEDQYPEGTEALPMRDL